MIEEIIGRESLLLLALVGCDHMIVRAADKIKQNDLFGSKTEDDVVAYAGMRNLICTEYKEECEKRNSGNITEGS